VPTIRARAAPRRSIDRSIDRRDHIEPRPVDRVERIDRRRARFDSVVRDRLDFAISDARDDVRSAVIEPRCVSRTRACFVFYVVNPTRGWVMVDGDRHRPTALGSTEVRMRGRTRGIPRAPGRDRPARREPEARARGRTDLARARGDARRTIDASRATRAVDFVDGVKRNRNALARV
jgi:hypothetical protein